MLNLLLAGFLSIVPAPAAGGPPVQDLAPPEALAPAIHEAILRGDTLWDNPPPGAQGVSCARCHADPPEPPTWAGSFPKVKPSFGTSLQVRTLEQAIRITVRTHYRLEGPAFEGAVRDLTAYLTWEGRGRPPTPGREGDGQIFPDRLQALEEAVGRGEKVFAARCNACHRKAEVATRAVRLPVALPTGEVATEDGLLRLHARARAGLPLGPDDQTLADLVAYLSTEGVGQPPGPGPTP